MGSDSKNGNCLIEDCGRPASIRGLCLPCYVTAREMVTTLGTATDQELMDMGLILAPQRGRRRVNPLLAKFRALKTA